MAVMRPDAPSILSYAHACSSSSPQHLHGPLADTRLIPTMYPGAQSPALSPLLTRPFPAHHAATAQIRDQYSELRDEFYASLEDRRYLSLAACRAKAPKIDWKSSDNLPAVPKVCLRPFCTDNLSAVLKVAIHT